jgi:putative FmdB family regulatory protein
MPIYEYACTNCEHAFDELQKISAAALVHCPRCGEPSLRKLLSAPKFRLKGQGWYETDFKTGNKRNIHGEAEKSSSSEGAETAKSDTEAASGSSSKSSASSPAKSTSDNKASST